VTGKGEAGLVVIPEGNPPTLTLTVPENPPTAVIETINGALLLPGETEMPDGTIARLKSAEFTTLRVSGME
jgi:hypothetical protein